MAEQVKWYKVFESEKSAKARVPQGQMERVNIGIHKICLAHTVEGFFAVSDTCTHLQAALSKGHMNYLNQVICPWHSFRFDLKTGIECQQRASPISIYHVKIDPDGLYLGINIPG